MHLSCTRQKEWAKIDPLSSFSSCPRIPQSGQGGRAALWAALRADPGRPSARPWRPFGPPLVLRAWPGRPLGRPGARLAALRPGLAATWREGKAAGRASEGRGKRFKPVAVVTMAASTAAAQFDSAALEISGAWLLKREADVDDGERVGAHDAQVAHATLLPRVRG